MKRPPDMPFKVYQELRKAVNEKLKFYMRGSRIWNSAERGTYVKMRDGEIKATETHS